MNSPVAKGVTDLTDPAPDATEVRLHRGWNRVVVRTEDTTGNWGFSLRLGLPPGIVCAQSDRPPQ